MTYHVIRLRIPPRGMRGLSMTSTGKALRMSQNPIDTCPLAMADGIQQGIDRSGSRQGFLSLQQEIDYVTPAQQGCSWPEGAQLSVHEGHTTSDLQDPAVIHD